MDIFGWCQQKVARCYVRQTSAIDELKALHILRIGKIKASLAFYAETTIHIYPLFLTAIGLL